MILSGGFNLLGVRVGRTGSTALARTFLPDATICLLRGDNAPVPFSAHAPIGEIRQRLRWMAPQEFFSFSVIRDPVSRLVSIYRFQSRAELADPGHVNHREYAGELPFTAWLHQRVLPSLDRFSFAAMVSDNDTRLDLLLRLEDLQAGIGPLPDWFRERLGRAYSNVVNASHHRFSRSDLTSKDIRDIADAFTAEQVLYDSAKLDPAALTKLPAAFDAERHAALAAELRARDFPLWYETERARARLRIAEGAADDAAESVEALLAQEPERLDDLFGLYALALRKSGRSGDWEDLLIRNRDFEPKTLEDHVELVFFERGRDPGRFARRLRAASSFAPNHRWLGRIAKAQAEPKDATARQPG